MHTKPTKNRPIPTAAQLRKRRAHTVCCWILRGLLVLTTILFTWITCWGCGLGWISRARAGSNWPIEFAGYGQMLLVGSGLLTLGTVLVLLYRLFPDVVRQLMHRQKLARMVLENQWYEQAERTKQSDGDSEAIVSNRILHSISASL